MDLYLAEDVILYSGGFNKYPHLGPPFSLNFYIYNNELRSNVIG